MNLHQIIKITGFFLLFLPSLVFAGDVSNVAVELQNSIKDAVGTWRPAIQAAALNLLMFFATISLTYKSYFILIEGGGFEHILAELIRVFLWVGFFWWVISNSDYLIQTVIDSFFTLADAANGGDSTPGIAGIFERGSVITGEILDQLSIFEPGQMLGIILLAIFVGAIYSLIAAHALFVLSELYVVTTAGVILLGFGGNQWTGSYAMNYFRYTFSVGMKVFSMFLVLGLGETFLHDWVSTVDLGNFTVLITVLGILITLYYLLRLIPDMVQAMVNGSSVGNATPSVGGMASAAVGAMTGAAATAAGGSLAVAEAIKSAQGMEGNAFGNTLGNLAQSGAEVLGNRIMGDYNASSGGMMASMAQHMRQQRTGGSGLYGGASSGNDHLGGSFGAGDPTTKEGTGPEEAENASHDFGGDGDAGGSDGGAGAAAWDTSKVGGKEHEFGADDGGSWSWDASGVAAVGGAGESDNPATRYRSPAVDLTRGGVASFGGGAESATTKEGQEPSFTPKGKPLAGEGMDSPNKSESGVSPSAVSSAGAQGFTTNSDAGVAPSATVGSDNMTSGVAAVSPLASSNSGSDAQSSTTKNESGVEQGSSGNQSGGVIGSVVGAGNMASDSSMSSSIGTGSTPQSAALGADSQGSTTKEGQEPSFTPKGKPLAGEGMDSPNKSDSSGVAPSATASGIAGGMVGSDNVTSGVAASNESEVEQGSGGNQSAGVIGSMVGADNMASGVVAVSSPSPSASSSVASSAGAQGFTTKNESGVAPSADSSDGIGSASLSGAVPPASGGSAAVTPRGQAGNKARPVRGVMRDTDSFGDGDAGGGKPAA